MIVVDTNVIAYLFIKGERTRQAENTLMTDPDWAAPYLWRSEFGNVLALYIRAEALSLSDGQLIVREAEAFMEGREYEPLSGEVLKLVANSSCSAYDCEFVALAHHFGVPLITADRKLLKEFPGATISIDAFGTSPESDPY